MEAMEDAARGAFRPERLVFRPVEDNDQDKSFIHDAILSDPVSRAMGNPTLFVPVTKAASYTEIEAGMRSSLLGLLICLPGEDVNPDAADAGKHEGGKQGNLNLTPIGFLFLHKYAAHLRRTRISIQLARQYQGVGYGTQAIRWALTWAFKWADLHRVEISAASYNERAVKLYAKLGFTLEGRQREAVFMNGAWYDIVSFGMLRREWEAQVGHG
ncbi:acyl-CoA N-acyltransferase [Apiospora saccharicola]|uniref:Acyl-CoA N-acyltransferase n=1 Tax=Apiospora saccharicola TaxID=335842 RepID=A0ABR1VKK3_9PEZI